MALVVLTRSEQADVEEPDNATRASSADELGATAANSDLLRLLVKSVQHLSTEMTSIREETK